MMSMLKCPRCEEVYDTDLELEMIDGELVCDRCWEKNEDKG